LLFTVSVDGGKLRFTESREQIDFNYNNLNLPPSQLSFYRLTLSQLHHWNGPRKDQGASDKGRQLPPCFKSCCEHQKGEAIHRTQKASPRETSRYAQGMFSHSSQCAPRIHLA
jgi:hypothetical protein